VLTLLLMMTLLLFIYLQVFKLFFWLNVFAVAAQELTSVKVGDLVRVKPTVKTPKYKWGSVTCNSIGTVTGQLHVRNIFFCSKSQKQFSVSALDRCVSPFELI